MLDTGRMREHGFGLKEGLDGEEVME